MSRSSEGWFTRALSRRRFLQLAGAAGAATLWPLTRHTSAAALIEPGSSLFLTAEEYTIVQAATARIFPSDSTPGALEAGVADYIQKLLSLTAAGDANCDGRVGSADVIAVTEAIGVGESDCSAADVDGNGSFDAADFEGVRAGLFSPVVPIFAGGPFSGREPFVDPQTQTPSDDFPPDSFVHFVPLNRVQRIAWEARLNGTGAAPELAGNPLANGPRVDLRGQYRTGLATIEAQSQILFSKSFVDLTEQQQTQVLARPPLATFMRQLRAQTMEGLFAAPEYGGNRAAVGWTLIGYGGDSQPLGYTLGFDEESGTYVERPDRPNSRPNPEEDCAGLSPQMLTLIKALVGGQPHFMQFDSPFCFGVIG